MAVTVHELEKLLENFEGDEGRGFTRLFYGGSGWMNLSEDFVVKVITSKGGDEEYGYGTSIIVEVAKRDTMTHIGFYQKSGYYASYSGLNWDGEFKKVTPQTKSIVVFE